MSSKYVTQSQPHVKRGKDNSKTISEQMQIPQGKQNTTEKKGLETFYIIFIDLSNNVVR